MYSFLSIIPYGYYESFKKKSLACPGFKGWELFLFTGSLLSRIDLMRKQDQIYPR